MWPVIALCKVSSRLSSLLIALSDPGMAIVSVQKFFKASEVFIKIVSDFFAQISSKNYSNDISTMCVYAALYVPNKVYIVTGKYVKKKN